MGNLFSLFFTFFSRIVITKEEFTPVLTYIYLEMKKFKKPIDQLETFEEKWMYILNHLCNLDHCPPQFKEEAFVKFFELARVAAFTDEEKMAYERSLREARDENNRISYAQKVKAIEIAKTMIADGLPLITIAKYTNLPIEEIEKL